MLSINFIETAQKAMNEHSEISRDKGLLENALTMTSFSIPSQADVINYEITLLTEKKNQIAGHIEELANEAAERLAEMNAERDAIMAEIEHYKGEYSEALRRKQIARTLYGATSQQVEKQQAAFDFAVEMYNKAQQQLTGIGVEILELETTLADLREQLTGETLSAIQESADDLPFESTQPAAVALSMDTFDALVKTHIGDVISYVERHRDLREPDETALTEAVITEISRGKVSAEDVLQSFDEVLDERYAAFYEHLNERYAQNPKFYQSELALCVEAYA